MSKLKNKGGMKSYNFIARLLPMLSGFLFFVTWPAFSQPTNSSASDDEITESLVGTTWSGTAFGENWDYYFLDDRFLVYRTQNGIFTNESWRVVRNTILIAMLRNPAYRLQLDFAGAVKGDEIIGTAKDLKSINPKVETVDSPWVLRKLSTPIPELLAAAPPNRPFPPAPLANAADFDGTFSTVVPKIQGQSTPTMNVLLQCKAASGCILNVDTSPATVYDKVSSLRRAELSQAKFALQYAKDHKDRAILQEPWLSPLLQSSSSIDTCLDLGQKKQNYAGAGTTGLVILCKLNINPWEKPVVLLMGTILANCGIAFCRYGMMPLFKQNTDGHYN